MKDINVFDFIKQIDKKSKDLKFDSKLCSPHMLALHYSHDNSLLEIVNKINTHLYNINSEYVYKYFFNNIPKSNRFIKWTKKNKIKVEDAENLMNLYNISRREAEECLL